jgi:hypothetical protein
MREAQTEKDKEKVHNVKSGKKKNQRGYIYHLASSRDRSQPRKPERSVSGDQETDRNQYSVVISHQTQ